MPLSPAGLTPVQSRISAFLERMRAETADYGSEAAALIDTAGQVLQGGKGLRARFCQAGWMAIAPGDAAEDPALWSVGAALEVFQAAALVHDDLIDNSDTRRGRPSAHRALEHLHERETWSGSASAFGRSSAILLGDLLVAWSDDLLEEGLRGHARADAVRDEYARMRRDVTIGQFLDVAEESVWNVTPSATHAERALRVVSLKAARYSVEQPLLLGATLAGADEQRARALRGFGHPVGLAFQLRDDILGVFGDPATTGKPAGDDLREGKRTVLIALTRNALPEDRQAWLDARIGDPDLGAADIALLQEAIVSTGALATVERMIDDYRDQAEASLADAGFSSRSLSTLRALGEAATARTA